MAMKRYSAFPKDPELLAVLPICGEAVDVFYSPSLLGNCIKWNGFKYCYSTLIMLYSHMQYHNDTIIKTHAGRLLHKYSWTSHFICKGSKRVTQGLRVRGTWRPNRNFNILTPLLWPSALCLSCSPEAQPEAQRPTRLGDGFLYCILSTTSLGPNSIGGPEPLRPGVDFLTTSRL